MFKLEFLDALKDKYATYFQYIYIGESEKN